LIIENPQSSITMLFPQDGAGLGAKKIYVAVMGMTGAGKSSFISLCSDQEVEIGHGLFARESNIESLTDMVDYL
jgi:predicted GTPase